MKKSIELHDKYFLEYGAFREDSCAKCGKTDKRDSEGFLVSRAKLTVHHIDGDVSHNSRENLQTLCRKCHDIIHGM